MNKIIISILSTILMLLTAYYFVDTFDEMYATPCIGGYYPMSLVIGKMITPTLLACIIITLLLYVSIYKEVNKNDN